MQFGKREELMGFPRHSHRPITQSRMCACRAGNVIIGAGGFGKLMSAFGLERLRANATQSLGVGGRRRWRRRPRLCFSEREAFGKPIIDFQAVQLKIAEMAMKVEAARPADPPRRPPMPHSSPMACPTVYEKQCRQMLCQRNRA